MPLSPQIEIATAVAIAGMATFTRLFPSKMVPISFSGFFNKRSTMPARLGFFSARCLKRNLLMAISAVSEPENALTASGFPLRDLW